MKNNKNQASSIKLKNTKVFGTKEWADFNYNIINGCLHDCKYCYSKEMAIRFKRKTPLNWKIEELRVKDLNKSIKMTGRLIMFPSSHDITIKHLDESILIINKLLKAGNSLLIVTKPDIICIKRICETFEAYKGNILFRFTISSSDSNILKFWEPFAPSFEVRFESLKHAFENGFNTSVSCEPMLDYNVEQLIDSILPYITDSIWLGKANFLFKRLKTNGINDKVTIQKANELIQWQSNKENIFKLYNVYKDNVKIKWKDSLHFVFNNE